jgi:hypothetical protein
MKERLFNFLYLLILIVFIFSNTHAQNPLIMNQFTADPTARVFEGKIYVYPSHDIPVEPGKGRPGWFCMEDYHVSSSEDLINWKDHGVIVSQNKVDWVDSTSYSMWAPDCVFQNGKYYFYFPAIPKEAALKRGMKIGVAIADKPYGPFKPESQPIEGIIGVDPNVFIDSDGQAYLYYSLGKIFVAKLKQNMIELADKPRLIENLPETGLIEGPFLFERNGIYYLTYPHVNNKIERLEYATGSSPLGPFHVAGVLMDESPTGCWTNHQSVVEYKGQWYLFYHHNDLSPQFDKNRSIRADSLFFNKDGTIKKVIPSFRGVGVTEASDRIKLDRYSLKSNKGLSIAFIDTLNKFKGWKTILDTAGAWIQYNSVSFLNKNYKSVNVKAFSKIGGVLEVRQNNYKGPLIASININRSDEWQEINSKLITSLQGIQNLVVVVKDNNYLELDWISFE